MDQLFAFVLRRCEVGAREMLLQRLDADNADLLCRALYVPLALATVLTRSADDAVVLGLHVTHQRINMAC